MLSSLLIPTKMSFRMSQGRVVREREEKSYTPRIRLSMLSTYCL